MLPWAIWCFSSDFSEGLRALILAFVVAFVAGALMVSRFPYISGKDFDWSRRVPVAVLVLIPLAFVLVGSSPPEMLFGLFGLFATLFGAPLLKTLGSALVILAGIMLLLRAFRK